MNANSRHYSSIDLMATSSRQRAVSDQLTEFHSSDRATSEARFLLREFSHRINNEFSSAIGAISIAAARSTNVEARAVLDAAQDRLQNYAKAHRALRFPEQNQHIDAVEYLRRLCQAITHSRLSNKGIELRFVERPLWMNSERSWRLGLIVSELITNAERHAFSQQGGWVCVELLPSTTFVECRVSDNGASVENIRQGHGLRIVKTLASGLGGTIDHIFESRGTTAVLSFPAANGISA